MVSISRANRVHRPERVLAYISDESFKITNSLYNGFCPEELLPYLYSFGTYDGIGTYRLSPELAKEKGFNSVVGLEFRPNDPKVKIPENLDKITIPENDYLLVRCVYDDDFDYSLISEAVNLTLSKHPTISDNYKFLENPVAVPVYVLKDQILVLHPIEIINQKTVINENSYSEVSKEDLFDYAQKDFITHYYNWTYMNQKLSSFGKNGVTDYCFVHFNVKDFNMINELFNHQTGNNHLCAITERIEECKDWIYFGARCDNDNFALMIKDMPDDEIVKKLTDFFEPISYLKNNPSYRIYYKCGVVTMMNCLNSLGNYKECYELARMELLSLKSFVNVDFEYKFTVSHLALCCLPLGKYEECEELISNKSKVSLTDILCFLTAKYFINKKEYESVYSHYYEKFENESKELIMYLDKVLQHKDKRALQKLNSPRVIRYFSDVIKSTCFK